jgi:hypothetical protein
MGFPHASQNHDCDDGTGVSLPRAVWAIFSPAGTMRLLPHFEHPSYREVILQME